MIVVFDSNVWISELGLRSSAAAAVRFYLKQSGARVAIPEVVRLEVTENLRRRLLEHIDQIRFDYRQLLTAFGKLREIVLPAEQEVDDRIAALFSSLGVEQFDIPFSLQSAHASFMKTIRKEPPSKNTQQFKDGVLWADCRALLETDSVLLVTSDKAFYEDQQYSQGLAKNLCAEASACSHSIEVFPALVNLLESVKKPISVDGNDLQKAFIEACRQGIAGKLESEGFALGERTDLSLKLFATEDAAVLFLDFTMTINCKDVRGEGRTDIALTLRGDGSYLPQSGDFRDLRELGQQLTFRLSDGTLKEMRSAIAYGGGVLIGHREISTNTRYALPGGDG